MRRLLLALVSAGFVTNAGAIEIETAQGTVDIPGTPETIAVFDIAAIDTLDRLGVRISGLPDTLFLPELQHLAGGAEKVGTLFEPNLEALSALDPDLIIVGGRSATQREAAERVAPAIDMTLYGVDLISEARTRIDTYGRLFGREDAAAEALAEFDAAIARAKQSVAGKGRALIIMTNGPKVSAYGAQSRFGWLHRELDLPAAMDESDGAQHGEAVSFEFIREADPDWLIVLDRSAAIGAGDANAKATLDNELVASTTAWKKGQVVYLPAADFYIAAGGAKATIRVLDAVALAFSGS